MFYNFLFFFKILKAETKMTDVRCFFFPDGHTDSKVAAPTLGADSPRPR